MLTSRPPIVTFMGHVDHGKTSLLDAVRSTNVAAREHGGITQAIGAYQVEFETKNGLNKVTFIDTPGHAAFSKMRARGAKVTDLVVLVISSSDGVMPQTKESLDLIKAAGVPYVIALNKVDLPEADIKKVKDQLSQIGVSVEGYGGEVVALPVSAKTGQGVKELLEMIVLLGQMQNLEGDPEGKLEAVVIESRSDSRRGNTATILVRNGSLKVGQKIFIDGVESKIRALFDENANGVTLAGPSMPVEVLGLTVLPPVGAVVASQDLPTTQNLPTQRPSLIPQETDNKLKIILKADVAGSLEALRGLVNDRDIAVLTDGIGEISDSDVLLAKTTGAVVYGFNVKCSSSAEKLAQEDRVKLKTFKIIYELFDDLEKRVRLMRNPNLGEIVLGQATIIAEFKIDSDRIAGCKVTEGRIAKSDTIHIIRGGQVLSNIRLKSMKHQKVESQEARLNQEFGAIFSPYVDFKIGDVLVSFEPANEL